VYLVPEYGIIPPFHYSVRKWTWRRQTDRLWAVFKTTCPYIYLPLTSSTFQSQEEIYSTPNYQPGVDQYQHHRCLRSRSTFPGTRTGAQIVEYSWVQGWSALPSGRLHPSIGHIEHTKLAGFYTTTTGLIASLLPRESISQVH
jgi:hypothetical protein